MARRSGPQGLQDHEAERVIRAIRRMIEDEGSQAAAARKLGMSPPSLHAILQGHNNPSLETARAVARAEHRSLADYIDEFWGPDVDPKYPSKTRAASSARNVYPGATGDEAIDLMIAEDPELDYDPGVEYWFKEVERFVSLLRSRHGRELPALPAASGHKTDPPRS